MVFAKGMIDHIESPQLAAKGSDLIFIATPVRVIPKFIQISFSFVTSSDGFRPGEHSAMGFDHLIPAPNKNLYCGFTLWWEGSTFCPTKAIQGGLLVTPIGLSGMEKILLRRLQIA